MVPGDIALNRQRIAVHDGDVTVACSRMWEKALQFRVAAYGFLLGADEERTARAVAGSRRKAEPFGAGTETAGASASPGSISVVAPVRVCGSEVYAFVLDSRRIRVGC